MMYNTYKGNHKENVWVSNLDANLTQRIEFMKKLKNVLTISVLLFMQKVSAQEDEYAWPSPYGDCSTTVLSSPCFPTATVWHLGGNIIPTGGTSSHDPCYMTDIGTCNATPFVLKSGNTRAVWIYPNEYVGIGTSSPSVKLEVADVNQAEMVAFSTGLSKKSGIWAMNRDNSSVTRSYGLTNDLNGIGHISFDMLANKNLLNFSWEASNSMPQIWIGDKVPQGIHSDFRLAVEGKILAQSIYVTAATAANWADYVFEDNYQLTELGELEKFYKKNKHLPEIPTAKEVAENGVDLAEMNVLLLKKVEELTLYVVDQQHKYEQLKKDMESLKSNLK
jgi:hypothetical protein